MKNKIFLLLMLLLSSNGLQAQQSVNDYKYIIVPIRYDFQRSNDQHQVNSLTKFLFEKEGFEVYFSDEKFPDELALNRCLALTAKLNDNSKLFSTKMNFDLVDCSNKVVYSTSEGTSKEKDYKTAYFACVRGAFEDIKELNYNYEPKGNDVVEQSVVSSTANNEVASSTPEPKKTTSTSASTNVVVPVTTTSVAKNNNEVKTTTVQPTVEKELVETPSNVLYAQPNANGYQVVDATPKVVYILLKTSKKDVFLLKDHSAMVYKDGEDWKVEYYENDKLIVKKLNLKFF